MAKYLAVATLLVGCGVEATEAPVTSHDKAPDTLLRQFDDLGDHSFIVGMSVRPDDPASAPLEHVARVERLAALTDIAIEHDWDQLALVQVRARTLEAALAALDSDDVEQAYEPVEYQLADAQSFPLMNQPAAAAAGKTGAGTAVAVLDTGANYRHAELGSCTAPNTPAGCRVAYAADFAPNDNSLDDNGHGTNVSGIVAGVAPGTKILALDVFNGAGASTTDILSALNWVLANRAAYNIAAINLSLGGGSSTVQCTGDAVGAALASARTAGIAPVVASGNNGYTNATSWPACAPAAISVGAVYDSNVGGLGYSSCSDPTTAADKITCFSNSASFLTLLAPGALITAAGYTMAGTSQAAPHAAGAFAVLRAAFPSYTVDQELALLTSTGTSITDPRNNITKRRIDLGAAVASTAADTTPPTNGTASAVATSGAVALTWTGFTDAGGIASYRVAVAAGATAPATCAAAIYTGASTTLTQSGLTNGTAYSYRICAVDKAGNVSTGVAVTATPHEMDAPVGSLKINAGATVSRTLAVTLTTTATDASGVTQMCLSEATSCTAWIAYAATLAYRFPGDGSRTLRAWYRDKWGTTSAPVSAAILVDSTAPTNTTITATASTAKLSLSWTASTDATSGVASYKLVGAPGTLAPASCAAGTLLYTGANRTFVHAVARKATWSYRVCTTDVAGNMSVGAVKTATAL